MGGPRHKDRAMAIQEGRRWFTPDRPCKNGHIAPTRVNSYRCSACTGEEVVEPATLDGYVSRKFAQANGLPRYYPGTTCPKGHRSERFTAGGGCCECASERMSSDRRRLYLREYYKDPKRREARREYVNAWTRSQRKTPEGRAISAMRSFIWRMAYDGIGKRTEEKLGYTKAEFIARIESQFETGMTWDNHGDWHIDHIKPISAFIEEGVKDPKIVNALDNLQPLWAFDNLSKGCDYGEDNS